MKFKKVYIELSNSCNFNCSFCQPSSRQKHFLSTGEFEKILGSVQPFTKYVYFHVLGEPMLHPSFQEFFLKAKNEYGFKVNISTNASLLHKHSQFLIDNPASQINFSLHDAEENVPKEKWRTYLSRIFEFSKSAAPATYVSLRLWNRQSEESQEFNELVLAQINEFYNLNLSSEIFNTTGSTYLSRSIFLNISPRFDWPDGKTERTGPARPCYALRDQIAILNNGTVVPCCIDAEAHIPLGNIYTEDLSQILQKDRAQQLRRGLSQGKFVEPFCKTCGFIIGKD